MTMRSRDQVRLALAAGIGLALLAASPARAESSGYDVQTRAYVPIECEADLVGSVSALSNGSFLIGNIRQFCNAPFQMRVSHPQMAAAAQLQFKNVLVPLGMGSTSIQPSSAAANGSAPLFLHGVTRSDAELFSASLILSVTPLGV
jgi:hypothetical protein